MDLKFLQTLKFITQRLTSIEKSIQELSQKVDFSVALQRNHLIRLKNGEDLDDEMILMGRPYNDLSPQKAYDTINSNQDIIILDVSKEANPRMFNSIHISLEDLNLNYIHIASKTKPVLVFSEKGLRSIQACEILVKKGFMNINNISGGFHFFDKLSEKESSKKSENKVINIKEVG